MNTIRIGIIGAGGVRGKEMYDLFLNQDDVEITTIADIDKGKMIDRYGGLAVTPAMFTNDADFLASAQIDAVVVATPDDLHERHACLALNAGKHVYLEKPMAITSGGCDHIMAMAKESGCMLYVGHNLRHFTVIKKLKEVINSGVIGEVKAVWCRHYVSYGRQAYYEDWHRYRANVGSLLIHKASHDIDVIHWLAGGHTQRVIAIGSLSVWGDQPGNPDVEDVSSVIMSLDNGVQANYAQCHFAHLACREYTIIGTEGTLRNQDDNPEMAVVQLFGKRRRDARTVPTQEWKFEPEKGFHGNADRRIVEEFIGILRGEKQPTISIKDAAWAVKTAYAATHSLRNGNIPINVV